MEHRAHLTFALKREWAVFVPVIDELLPLCMYGMVYVLSAHSNCDYAIYILLSSKQHRQQEHGATFLAITHYVNLNHDTGAESPLETPHLLQTMCL